MTILHVISSMDPISGGPCQGLRNSVGELDKLGIYREVVSVDDPSSSFLGQDTFIIHALGPSKTSWSYSSKLFPWLRDNLSRFDVVIVNGLWQYHGYATRKAINYLKKRQKKSKEVIKVPKVFVMPHGMLDPYFQRAANRKLKAIRNWFYWKLIEGKIVNEASAVFFTCEEELRLAREPFRPYHPRKEINVGYGTHEPPIFTSLMHTAFIEKCPGVQDYSYFIFLSRIHPKKGIDLLIKAYSKLFRKWSNNNREVAFPKLVIAGPGIETPFGQMIKAMVSRTPELPEMICFAGMLTGDAKWGAFYGCEAFVLPSHQENFGISVAEAMACSKPVLISNQVNIWKEIETGGGGIVANDTEEGTFELLQRWQLLNKYEKNAMSENARTTYEKHFAIAPAAAKMIQALNM